MEIGVALHAHVIDVLHEYSPEDRGSQGPCCIFVGGTDDLHAWCKHIHTGP